MLISKRMAAGLGMCVALLSAPALAQPPVGGDGPSARTVRYTREELANPEGAKRVAARIRDAADAVCGGDSLLQRFTPSFERCRREVRNHAVAQLDTPAVAAR